MKRLTKKINNPCLSNDYEMLCAHEYHVLNKLGMLEDLEEEIGCPLEVLFKALKNGVYDEYGNWYKTGEFCLDYNWLLSSPNDKYLAFNVEDTYFEFKLCDYKKTWWLKSDKSE